MIICIKIAFMAAVIGYVYARVLIQPGEVLSWLYRFFQKHLTRQIELPAAEIPDELKEIGFNKPGPKKTKTVEHWLLKPLGACEKCVSGQLALWFFVGYSILQSYNCIIDCIFTIPKLIFTICLSILITILFRRLLDN